MQHLYAELYIGVLDDARVGAVRVELVFLLVKLIVGLPSIRLFLLLVLVDDDDVWVAYAAIDLGSGFGGLSSPPAASP